MQIPTWLTDPVVFLLLQLLISAATVVVSILVARRWGEMAAAKYTLKTTERSGHHRSLVDAPLVSLRNALSSELIPMILTVFQSSKKELETRTIDLNQSNSPEGNLFLQHVENGYPELYSRMLKYRETYNELSASVLQVYNEALKKLLDKWGSRPTERHWKIDGGYLMMNTISNEVTNRLVRGYVPHEAVANSGVNLSGVHIADTSSLREERKIAVDINSLLADDQVFGKLQRIFNETKPLVKECEYFSFELNNLRAYIQAGNKLRGWCKFGRDAGYE